MMRNDIQALQCQAFDHPSPSFTWLTERVYTGRPGRPAIRINPDFLAWASKLRTISGIADFLGLERKKVRQEKLENGLEAICSYRENLSLSDNPVS